jgi:hypothetical protein
MTHDFGRRSSAARLRRWMIAAVGHDRLEATRHLLGKLLRTPLELDRSRENLYWCAAGKPGPESLDTTADSAGDTLLTVTYARFGCS